MWCPTTTGETAMFLLFSFAGVGLERLISTIHPNPPLSALRFFSLLRFGKTKLLFCSHLNRNADKEGLWQDFVLHCFAIVIVASSACKNRLEISIWSPTIEEIREGFLFFYGSGGGLMSSVISTRQQRSSVCPWHGLCLGRGT